MHLLKHFVRVIPTLAVFFSLTVSAAQDSSPPVGAVNVVADPAHPIGGKTYVLDVVISEKGILLDFADSAEVFRETADVPFAIHYVAATMDPVTLKGGIRIVPDYTFETAPRPDYVLVGGQGTSKAPAIAISWLQRQYADHATLVSVCNGLDWLAQTGLLDNKAAVTHHLWANQLQQKFSSVRIVDGKRYVQSDPYIFTGAGFSSGMDVALHIVDVRFGREIAKRTADRLEYRGDGWITNENAYSNAAGK